MSIKKILINAAILGCTFATFTSAVTFADTKGTLNDNEVNVRNGADKSFDIIDKLSIGDAIGIIGEEGSWVNVSYGVHDSAYIFKDYVEVIETDGVVNKNKVEIKEEPDEESSKIDRLNSGDEVLVLGKTGDWYLISFDDIEGYVYKDYIDCEYYDMLADVDFAKSVDEKYGVVTAVTGLNFRSEPSRDAEVLSVLPFMTKADVIDEDDDWVHIETEDGIEGYVNCEFFEVRTGDSEDDDSSTVGGQVVNYAKQFIGTPYVWGGSNLTSGVDCSGFVTSVYKNFGISLNRSSSAMEAGNGYYINKSELQAGDLVFFDNDGSGSIDHVGIYMYDGYYIHSSSGKVNGVTISSLYDSYSSSSYASSKRVLG